MIKIIKQGRVIDHDKMMHKVCQKCECIFEFSFLKDTKVIPVGYDETQRVIECPCCGTESEVTL